MGNRNNLINDTLSYKGEYAEGTAVTSVSYDGAGVVQSENEIPEKISCCGDGRIRWVRVRGLSDVERVSRIADLCGMDFLSKQDILNVNHPVKIEIRETHIIFILKLFHFSDDNGADSSQLSLVLGHDYVVTFSEAGDDTLDDIEKALERNIFRIRSKSADYLADVILNHVIGNYMSILLSIDNSLDDIESELVSGSSDMDLMINIQRQRKIFLMVKQVILPLKDQYYKLLRADTELMNDSNGLYLSDINDHIQYCLQQYEAHKETISSLIDMHKGNNELKMNDIMKKLTLVSTIFIPLTFLAGVWGMNFRNMPELEWKYGYAAALCTMLVSVVVLYLYFKKKKWQ